MTDLEAMIHEMIDRLRDKGVTHANGGNLYLNLADSTGSPVHVPAYDNGMLISEPYRTIADEHGI